MSTVVIENYPVASVHGAPLMDLPRPVQPSDEERDPRAEISPAEVFDLIYVKLAS